MQKSSLTHYKLNKQLQNSLWLRIYSGQIAFMQSRLNNSTKFHFGIIRNDFKTNLKQFNPQQHNNNNNHKNSNKKKSINKSRSWQLVNGYSFHLPWSDRCGSVTNHRTSLKQQLDKAEDKQRPTKWIHNNNFASNGTVIRPIWQSHSPIYSNPIYWPMSHYPAMVS